MSFENNDQLGLKNVLIALVTFTVFMVVYSYFFGNDQHEHQSSNAKSNIEVPNDDDVESSDEEITIEQSLSKSSRVRFENEEVFGSLDLVGGVIDQLCLKKYKETTDNNSQNVMLLVPRKTKSESYYLISYKDKTHGNGVSGETVWTKVESGDGEKKKQAVTIKTKTENGIIVERTMVLDGYVINIRDKIINVSDDVLKILAASDLVSVNPVHNNYTVVHDGLVGNSSGTVKEIKYSDVQGNTVMDHCEWIGYTNIYWLCSIINKNENMLVSYSKTGEDSYKCSTRSKKHLKLKPNSAAEMSYSIFVGPKDVKVLNYYAECLELDKFDMSIDFGWFFMITKPLLHLLGVLGSLFHSMWIVIFLLTLFFKILTFPLMQKSFASAAKMKALQPKIAALQKLYANDKLRMNQEMMQMYKKEKVSPMSGCFPMLLQAPIFFCLYKVFFISIEMRHAPLFGWIHDLSAPDQMYIFNLFGLIDWIPPSLLQIGVWPLIMGVTMLLQQKLSSGFNSKKVVTEKTSEAKIQENMMLVMPVLFTYICASFPVGVIIYWTISNIFSIIQQYFATNCASKKKK
jgi:YidC/Oxa1 family membrane protein insertase